MGLLVGFPMGDEQARFGRVPAGERQVVDDESRVDDSRADGWSPGFSVARDSAS